MQKSQPLKKTCPRCKSVCPIEQKICEDCGLNFSKLDFASNKLAKKNFWQGKRDEIIKAPMIPTDVSKKKSILLAVCLGFFGAHNIYLGRYIKALIQLCFGIFTLVVVAVASATSVFYNKFVDTIAPFVGIMTIIWIFDVLALFAGKYKTPISIDLTQNSKKSHEK